MGSFKLGKMTLRSLFGKPETVLYPFETRPQPEDLKGSVQVDMKACILCGICQKRCPTGCITVEKDQETWTINPFDCIQCRTCIRECPQHCLVMAPDYTKPAAEKIARVCAKPAPTEEELAEQARKEAEKQEKIAKALAAKKAREEAKAAKEAQEAQGSEEATETKEAEEQ